jgi:hypothetical protein
LGCPSKPIGCQTPHSTSYGHVCPAEVRVVCQNPNSANTSPCLRPVSLFTSGSRGTPAGREGRGERSQPPPQQTFNHSLSPSTAQHPRAARPIGSVRGPHSPWLSFSHQLSRRTPARGSATSYQLIIHIQPPIPLQVSCPRPPRLQPPVILKHRQSQPGLRLLRLHPQLLQQIP